MLVISQKVGEKIQLGSDITISVLEVKSGKVRLGIEAPKTVPVLRKSKDKGSDKKADSNGISK
ncbi:MAG: carbon storage regulator [Succinivibrio sp.]